MKTLKIAFATLWIISLLLILTFEMNYIADGFWTKGPEREYILNMICVILSPTCSFFACRLFKTIAAHRDLKSEIIKWGWLRLILNALSILPALLIYYGIQSSSAFFCFLIGLTASLFCIPRKLDK